MKKSDEYIRRVNPIILPRDELTNIYLPFIMNKSCAVIGNRSGIVRFQTNLIKTLIGSERS